jgi:hypothetical protein
MTVSSTTVKNSYSGDGSNDTFVYGFKIFASSDLQVIIRSATGTETTKTLTTDYTVTGVGTTSGGNVVFEAAAIPTATETVVLIRNVPQTQAIDYIANDPFPAETHEEGLDRATMTIQQMQEEINRSIKLSKTNTMTSTEFAIAAADRANKVLAFDSTGEISVTQELGTYKGTDTTVTTVAYVQRDIVKSTSAAQLNNVYICVGDSVVGDLLTDTDHFDLLVDAVSAATSAAAAASSAVDAQTAQTAAELAETNAETAETNAETAETNAAASEANAATSETNAAASEAAAAASESNASTSETNATTQAGIATTQAGIATTQAGNASTSASNAATSESNAATSESNAATSESNAATSASNAATSESNAATSESNAATSASAAAASADAFDDVYLGSKSSDPTTDNDGDPLAAGMLYYNSVSNIMRIYSGSAWENVAVSTAGFTTLTGVETLTNKTLTAPKIANGGFVADANGNEQIIFTTTASAVNELTVVNSATSNAPEISSTGGDTNIDLKITPKGTGNVLLSGIVTAKGDGSSTDGQIQLNCSQNSHGVKIKSPAHASGQNYTLILPTSVGTNGQVLASDGNNTNQLSWITASENKPTISSISPSTVANTATNVVITGTNFEITPNVEIINSNGGIQYPNTIVRNSATELTINVTIATDANYFIRVENPNGLAVRSTTALLTVSDAPVFSTSAGSLGSFSAGSSISTSVLATSDSAVTYSIFSGAFPSGIALNTSTGAITGTDSSGVTDETVFNFTIRATDLEAQTVDRAFSLTITVGINNAGQFN